MEKQTSKSRWTWQNLLFGLVILCTIAVIAIKIYRVEKANASIYSNVSIEEGSEFHSSVYTVNNLNDKSIYGNTFITAVDYHYNQLKKGDYTLSNPLMIYNLFGTNKLGLNIYFESDANSSLDYTISVDDEAISDFTRTLKNDGENNLTKKHEYQLIGFVKGYVNNLTLTLKDESGNVIETNEIQLDFTSLQTESQLFAEITEGESTSELEDGLYTICGNDSDTQDYMAAYDNDGILRSEIPIIGYRSHKVLFTDNNTMMFSISQSKIVEMSRLGEVVEVYKTGHYHLHHDYTFANDGNLLVLANNNEKDTEEDCIIKINLVTKEVTEVIDFEPMFQSYVDTCHLDTEGARDEGEDGLDWLHLNSIEYVHGDVFLSSRETSSILKVSDLETNPTLEFIISDEKIWENTEFSDYVFTKVGDFKIHAGQHSLNYIEGEEEGVYYIAFFDNNYGKANSQPDFDYQKLGITNQNPFGGDHSYYYVYKINENERTFELVDSVELVYSGIVSSVQHLSNGNLLTDSGTAGVYAEFDENHNLIRSFRLNLNKYMVYRVFKYDYKQLWFN